MGTIFTLFPVWVKLLLVYCTEYWSGMYGLKALQADDLVAQRQEVKPAVQMRNSVDTYYRNVLPTAKTSSYTFNRFRSQPLLRAKPMVELAPKRMGSTYFNTFMAVP